MFSFQPLEVHVGCYNCMTSKLELMKYIAIGFQSNSGIKNIAGSNIFSASDKYGIKLHGEIHMYTMPIS